ncbi:hypothetical protein ACJX0J_011576, partial [Zea mays]
KSYLPNHYIMVNYLLSCLDDRYHGHSGVFAYRSAPVLFVLNSGTHVFPFFFPKRIFGMSFSFCSLSIP